MIRKLRVKFVCILMSVIMLIVGVVLGVVIHFTAANMEMRSVSMMRAIADSPFRLGSLGIVSEEVRLPFFTVKVSSRGNIITANSGYFDVSDWEFLQAIVSAALDSDKEIGELKEYNLRFLISPSLGGCNIVFSDTTNEEDTLETMLRNCLIIFLGAMVVFLGISILLSYWAVKPVQTAWDQQKQFVADASHELKTPLSVILANAELLKQEDISRIDHNHFADNVLTTAYQMRGLVENLLEMAKADNGTMKMQFDHVNFSQIVNDALLSFQFLYEEQSLGLRSSVQEEVYIHGSEQHLYQVMDVLLDNALKYSDPQGMVSIDLVKNGKNCVLTVASPGEPISKEDLKNIFKRFYRIDKARARNGSSGLGLSIAETIVKSHRGKIWAESSGRFNTFFVQLPAISDGK